MRKRKRKYRVYDEMPRPIFSFESLRISLDGGGTWIPAHEIRIKVSDLNFDEELYLVVNDDGVKADVVRDHEVLSSKMTYHCDVIDDLE